MSAAPLDQSQPSRTNFAVDGHPPDPLQPHPVANVMTVSADVFRTLGVRE